MVGSQTGSRNTLRILLWVIIGIALVWGIPIAQQPVKEPVGAVLETRLGANMVLMDDIVSKKLGHVLGMRLQGFAVELRGAAGVLEADHKPYTITTADTLLFDPTDPNAFLDLVNGPCKDAAIDFTLRAPGGYVSSVRFVPSPPPGIWADTEVVPRYGLKDKPHHAWSISLTDYRASNSIVSPACIRIAGTQNFAVTSETLKLKHASLNAIDLSLAATPGAVRPPQILVTGKPNAHSSLILVYASHSENLSGLIKPMAIQSLRIDEATGELFAGSQKTDLAVPLPVEFKQGAHSVLERMGLRVGEDDGTSLILTVASPQVEVFLNGERWTHTRLEIWARNPLFSVVAGAAFGALIGTSLNVLIKWLLGIKGDKE